VPAAHPRKGRLPRPVVALVIDAVHPYSRGGREVRYHEVTRRLADRAEYHVYTMRWWDGPRVRREGSITFHAVSPLIPMYHGGRRSLSQAFIFSLCCVRLLWCRYDILEADHIPHFQVLVLRLIATARCKRFVVTWHEVWGLAAWRDYLGWIGFAAWAVEWAAMRLPDHIIAASRQTEDGLRAILGTRASITVAPNGIDLEVIRAVRPSAAAVDVVVVGRLMPHKRVDMLLDAIAILHDEDMHVTCRVIGDGPERDRLKTRAQALGLDRMVEFRHDVSEQGELYALVKAAKMFVFPSDREGFGAAVLEALACGVPVVTTSAPGNLSQHLVGRASRGVICDPTAPALADAIQKLLAEAERREPGEAAEPDPWLADYSWAAVSEQVAQSLGIS
jgi:glycosyltransferase involved in cell wall biosynthesis